MNEPVSHQNIYCMWCGRPTGVVWVHGHGQCRHCGVNIDECCRGERNPAPNEGPSDEDPQKIRRK